MSPTLTPLTVFTNDDIKRVFRVGHSGGMRKSNSTNSLVLITNPVESLYEDHWHDGVLHYTGMGQEGNQDIHRQGNGTLAESGSNGVVVHLFEVFTPKQYTYQGRVSLDAAPYEAEQLDRAGTLRRVWVFPLRLEANATPLPLDATTSRQLFLNRVARKNRVLTNSQIKQIEKKPAATHTQTTTTTRVVFVRDPDIVLYALRRAAGKCELCEKPAPFITRDGLPFLEVHHITYLSNDGKDSIDNVSALCPNCHRRMHALERPQEIAKLKRKALRLLSL